MGTLPAPTTASRTTRLAHPVRRLYPWTSTRPPTVQSNALAWTVDTGSIPVSPWQTGHASPPPGAVFVAACAAVLASSWQARQASWIGGIDPVGLFTPIMIFVSCVGRTPGG